MTDFIMSVQQVTVLSVAQDIIIYSLKCSIAALLLLRGIYKNDTAISSCKVIV